MNTVNADLANENPFLNHITALKARIDSLLTSDQTPDTATLSQALDAVIGLFTSPDQTIVSHPKTLDVTNRLVTVHDLSSFYAPENPEAETQKQETRTGSDYNLAFVAHMKKLNRLEAMTPSEYATAFKEWMTRLQNAETSLYAGLPPQPPEKPPSSSMRLSDIIKQIRALNNHEVEKNILLNLIRAMIKRLVSSGNATESQLKALMSLLGLLRDIDPGFIEELLPEIKKLKDLFKKKAKELLEQIKANPNNTNAVAQLRGMVKVLTCIGVNAKAFFSTLANTVGLSTDQFEDLWNDLTKNSTHTNALDTLTIGPANHLPHDAFILDITDDHRIDTDLSSTIWQALRNHALVDSNGQKHAETLHNKSKDDLGLSMLTETQFNHVTSVFNSQTHITDTQTQERLYLEFYQEALMTLVELLTQIVENHLGKSLDTLNFIDY